MDNVPKETHVVSVMTHKTLGTEDKVRDEKDDRLLLHPIRRQKKNRLTARDKNPHRDQAVNRKTHWTRVKFLADSSSVKIRHVNSGILQCVRITSLKKDVSMATRAISDILRQKETQQKVEERRCERISCDVEGVYTIGLCISRFLSEKVCSTAILGSKHAVKFSNGTWKERVHREVLSKSVRLMSVVLARRNSRKDHMGDLDPRTIRPQSSVGLGENICKLKNSDTPTFYTPTEKWTPAPTSTRPEEREFAVDSGPSVHMMSKKGLRSEEMGPQ